jgi:hypothetical protein
MKTMSRRTVLRGTGGVTVALPFLDAMLRPNRSRAQTVPRRFLACAIENGEVYPEWFSSGTETNFRLSPILSPLEPHKKDIVLIAGVDQMGGRNGDPNVYSHAVGKVAALTGQSCYGNDTSPTPSLDQFLAPRLSKGTPLPSALLHVNDGGQQSFWRGNNQRAQAMATSAFYKVVFSDNVSPGATDPEIFARLRARRRSVLDTVFAEYKRMSAAVGPEDRARLEAHAQSIRGIEQALDLQPNPTAACRAVREPEDSRRTDFPTFLRASFDLAIMALACDLTRVAGAAIRTATTTFSWVGAAQAHHDLSHRWPYETPVREQMIKCNTWMYGQLAYIIDRLKQLSEPAGGGTVFDNTLVLWINELSHGAHHSRNNSGFVLAGRAGGKLRTGRFLNFMTPEQLARAIAKKNASPAHGGFTTGVPHNNALVSIARILLQDGSITTFGKPEWCTGPLPGLE